MRKHHHPGPCAPGNRLCWLEDSHAGYRAFWRSRPARPPLRCVHLGEPTGESRECLVCRGKLAVPLLHCRLHSVCSKDILLPEISCCRICPDASFESE